MQFSAVIEECMTIERRRAVEIRRKQTTDSVFSTLPDRYPSGIGIGIVA